MMETAVAVRPVGVLGGVVSARRRHLPDRCGPCGLAKVSVKVVPPLVIGMVRPLIHDGDGGRTGVLDGESCGLLVVFSE